MAQTRLSRRVNGLPGTRIHRRLDGTRLQTAVALLCALIFVVAGSTRSPGQDAATGQTAPSDSAVVGQVLVEGKTAAEWIEAAEAALQEGDIEQSLLLLERATEAEPENHVPRLRRALLLMNLDETELALAELKGAIAACPPTAELHAFAGVALVNLARAEEAVEQLERALALDETAVEAKRRQERGGDRKPQAAPPVGLSDAQRPQVLNMAGVAHLALIHWDEAQEYFRKALKLDPTLVDAQANLAIYYRHRRQPDKAYDAYNAALKLDSNDVTVLKARAEQDLILLRHESAKADLDKAIALAAERGEAHDPALFWNAALAEWRLGNDDQTQLRIGQTRDLDPESPEARVLTGFIEAKTSRRAPSPAREINRLLKDADRAVKEDRISSAVLLLTDADLRAPGDNRALHARGRAHAQLGQLARAADDLDRAILAFDRDGDSAYWRANVAFELGRYHEAIVHYRRALALRSHYCEPWLGLGNALLQVRRYAEAVVAYDNYLLCGEATASLYNNRGVANWNLNLLDQALEDFNKALQLDPEYWNALFNRGVLLGQMGDVEGACRDLLRVREVWPDDPDVARWIAEYNCDNVTTPEPPPPSPTETETPTATASPSPSVSPTPTKTKVAATAAPTFTPSLTPSPSPSPSPSQSPTPSPSPSASPSLTASPSPSPSPSPTAKKLAATPTPSASPSPIPTSPPVPTAEPAPPPVIVLTPAPSPTPAKPPARTPIPPTPTPTPPQATPIPVSHVSIQTDPSGAFIAIDGRYVGVSPIVVDLEQMVEHRVTVLGEKRIVQELTYLPPRGQNNGSLRVALGPIATFNDIKLEAPRLQKRLDAQLDNPLLLVQMAEVALADNSYELAAQLAARALDLAPEFAYAEKALGIYQANIAFRAKNAAKTPAEKADAQAMMDMAQAHLDAALKAFPATPWALVAHASPNVLAGNYDAAQKDFELALKADPSYVPAINSLAGLEIQRGFRAANRNDAQPRFDAAEAHLAKALAIQPDSVDALTRLALIEAFVKGDNQKAIDLSEQAMRIDPADPQPFIIRGNAYIALQRLDEARDDLIRALILNPNDPDTRKTLESILEKEK